MTLKSLGWIGFGFGFLFAQGGFARDFHIGFIPVASPTFSALEWSKDPDTTAAVVQTRDPKRGSRFYATLKGKFSNPNASIIYDDQEVGVSADGSFSVDVPVRSAQEDFFVTVVDEKGNVHKDAQSFLFPEWSNFLIYQNLVPKRHLSLIPAVGVTSVSYRQTSVPSISAIWLTPKVTASYALDEDWSIDANIYFNTSQISSNSELQVRFLGSNIKVAWKIPKVQTKRWGFKLSAGYYFNTTFTSSAAFGYKNINSVELFPIITRYLEYKRSIYAYVKYSPILNGLSMLSANNTEVGAGIGFVFAPLENKSTVSVSFDYGALKLQLVGIGVQSYSYTLGVGYRFPGVV